MEFITFEPGDMTSYRVFAHRLTAEESREEPGSTPGDLLFGFGSGGGPWQSIVLCQNKSILHFQYYYEKMTGRAVVPHIWTLAAGCRVAGYILGRAVHGLPDDMGDMHWRAGWGQPLAQLTALTIVK